MLRITENFDRALTAILIGNNIVNVACAAIATVLFVGIFQKNPSVTDSLASALATAATTVIVFLFGGMLPKCIAKANAERYALFISGSLAFVMAILRPLTFVFMQISRLLSFIFRSKEEPTAVPS